MKRSKRWIGLGLILLVGAFVWWNRETIDLQPETLRDWILSFGWWAPVIYVVLYTLRPLVWFPSSIFSLAGGLAFGFWGFFLSVAGAVAGAALSFLIARWFGAELVKKEWTGKAKTVQKQMEAHGFLYVLAVRLVPVVNFDVVSYAAGLSKVRFGPYLLGTAVGLLPGAAAYTLAGASIAEQNITLIGLAVAGLVLVSMLPIVVRKMMRKRRGITLPGSEEKGERSDA
ncbi:TVP38/TMEM64 family protein [Salsuginibacillus halophilus]|nr:TVP38/TMEM64 family protein [Salsuginibacillus halophilus]